MPYRCLVDNVRAQCLRRDGIHQRVQAAPIRQHGAQRRPHAYTAHAHQMMILAAGDRQQMLLIILWHNEQHNVMHDRLARSS